MAAVHCRAATAEDCDDILSLTNDAFMADAFFKKKEYHLRFDPPTVREMMEGVNSRFIVASMSIDGVETKCGSIFLHWEIEKLAEELKVRVIFLLHNRRHHQHASI